MADTAALRTYEPRRYPELPGGERRFFDEELKRISVSVKRIVDVLVKLEARIEALEAE